jgi:hypothetical protein
MVQGQLVNAICGHIGEIPRAQGKIWPYFVAIRCFWVTQGVTIGKNGHD